MSQSDLSVQESNLSWYAISTKPQREFSVVEQINAKKQEYDWRINCYLPQVHQTNQNPQVLFRGYVFVQHDNDGFHRLKYIPGVKEYVRFSEYPSVIPDQDIATIKLVERHFNGVQALSSRLVEGAKVQVVSGVLAGRCGILTETARGKKVALEFAHLGHNLLVQVPTSDLIVL